MLQSFGPQEAAATSKFCAMVDSFFDCLNVRSLREHERKRKPFLAPYRSTDDERYVNMLKIIQSLITFYEQKFLSEVSGGVCIGVGGGGWQENTFSNLDFLLKINEEEYTGTL